MNNWIRRLSVALLLATGVSGLRAQEQKKADDKEAEYTRVITQRADKIVKTLDIADQEKAAKVRGIIADQYRSLNELQEDKKSKVKSLKEEAGSDKEAMAAKMKKVEDAQDKKISKLHSKYVSRLSKELNEEQVAKVKDGMTFNVLPITYKGYLEMLPTLSEKQKAQILAYLTEAREHAIDAESAEKKHWWFGKYKGRINNYLSAEGIETKTAREVWEKKLKERQQAQ